ADGVPIRKPLEHPTVDPHLLDAPLPLEEAQQIKLKKGPNIQSLPVMDTLPDHLEIPVLLKMGDNISTDEILAGGSRVLPYRSNLQEISKFCFEIIDDKYYEKSLNLINKGGHLIVGGSNYGQGSSREHAALAPRYLGLRIALAKDFARIHWQNLINFGILPLTFVDEKDYKNLQEGDVLAFLNLREEIKSRHQFPIYKKATDEKIMVEHMLSERHLEMVLQGGMINWVKNGR